jgi:cytochrome c
MFIGGLGIRSAVAMAFGPYKSTEALYYATFDSIGGSIRRVAYTPGAQPPVADVKTVGENHGGADPNTSGFQISFDASGTRDPNGDANLTYKWDWNGDGTVDESTATPTMGHTYTERGKYAATLTVEDSANAVSEPAKIDVFPGDAPPDPAIT